MVRNPHLAEDVTQATFIAVAQSARQLVDCAVLPGWLHRTTQNLAANSVRSDVRRRAREQEAAVMNELLSAAPNGDWQYIARYLDEALRELSEPDRDAVLLRYFKNHDLRTVGATLGISEDAAQKRVSRAVERLREFFAKRGLTVGASGLAIVISANAVQAAPVGLAVTISTAAALTGTTLATTATVTATKVIAMTALQKTIVAATVAILAGAGIYEAHHASQLGDQVQTLQQQQAPLTQRIQQLERERGDATNSLASLTQEIAEIKRDSGELLRLRSEVMQLRGDLTKSKGADANDPMQTEMKSWLARVDQIKQRFEQTPGSKIPELQFLTQQDWLDATKMNQLSTDEDYQKAMAGLRMEGATRFGMVLQGALSKYAQANNGKFPTDLSQLLPYLDAPVDSAILQRYQIMPGIYLGNDAEVVGDWAITQNAALDERADLRIAIGIGCIVQGHLVETDRSLDSAISAFASANNGRMPRKIYDLKPYVTTPAEQAAFQKRTTFNRNNPPPTAAPVLSDTFPSLYQ
jgi:RNA polymerase sigma factor (sigma-70 family)